MTDDDIELADLIELAAAEVALPPPGATKRQIAGYKAAATRRANAAFRAARARGEHDGA